MKKRLVMLNLTHFGRGEGGALHQRALMRRFLELGHDVRMVTPARAQDTSIDASLRPHVVLSRSVARFGLPTVLDGLLQLWPLLRARQAGAQVLYVRANLFTLPQVLLARLLGMRVVVEHNSWTAGERRARGGGPFASRLEQVSQVWSARCAHKSRCVTAGIASLLEAHGVARDKLHVIGNGTDVAAWAVAREAAAGPALQLGFIGILSAWQGVGTAIRALALARQHAPFELTIVGDGPERAALADLARELGLVEHVHFAGYVAYPDAPAAVARFDIALAPFTRARNELIGLAPIKLRDYAAAGKPVIAARLPGITELEDGGWLRTHVPDDAGDLAARIVELEQLGRTRLDAMGRQARAYAEQHFDWARLADEVIRLC